MENLFNGKNGFLWFQGVIEDVNDPLELGRVRVRIFGIHSIEKIPNDKTGKGIPTDDLPWSQPSLDITNASTSGIGESPVGCVNGTHVWGFSRDIDYMDLVICGTFVGIPKTKSNGKGFQDPDQVYPTRLNESDLSRLARGNITGTWVENQKKNLTSNELFKELESSYNAKYPFNKVNTSRSGHVSEIDDTPKNERISAVHKSGSYSEYKPDGSKSEKILKDNYSIVLGDDHLHVEGDVKIFINGNVTQIINGNSTQTVKGNVKQTVQGNSTQTVKGNVEQTVQGNTAQTIKGNVVQSIKGMFNLESKGSMTLKAPSIKLDGEVTVTKSLTAAVDVIAGLISLISHKHIGNLGKPTSPPL